MKTSFLIAVVFALIFCSNVNAQTKADTILATHTTQIQNLNQQVVSIKTDVDTIKTRVKAAVVAGDCEACKVKNLSFIQQLYILLPVLLFLLFFFYFMDWLKKEKFKLSDSLSNDIPSGTFTTTQTSRADPADASKTLITTVEQPDYSRSSSRLIAFLTGISAMVVALSLITYFAYGYIKQCPNMPPLDDLWKIIAGLGIGVVPYVSKMLSSSSTK